MIRTRKILDIPSSELYNPKAVTTMLQIIDEGGYDKNEKVLISFDFLCSLVTLARVEEAEMHKQHRLID